MKKPPGAETVATGAATVLRSRSMFDQIVFARSELSGRGKCQDVIGDSVIRGPEADTLQAERFNFVPGVDGLCYAMPMSQGDAAPHPEKRDGWLVLFVVPENSGGTAVLRPVGWYEEACFAGSYQHRPEPELQQYLFIVSTQAKSAYVIPGQKRPSCATAIGLRAQTFTTLYSFAPSHFATSNGANPYAGLVQATDGDLYGTTAGGGAYAPGWGTVFKITPSGTLTRLHSFCTQSGCPDGQVPNGGLIQATDGDFYGTTAFGGTGTTNCYSASVAVACGTVFKITPTGTLTTVYNFCSQSGCTDEELPNGGLIQATDGDFYGTTQGVGGAGAQGTVFKITPAGTLTTLHSFDWTDGGRPYAGLVQATNGDFYGTTEGGGGLFIGHGLQPVCRSRPVRGRTAYIRQGGNARQNSGKRSDRRDQRHV